MNKYNAMTVNERLHESGLLNAFDKAVRKKDSKKLRWILSQVNLEEQAEQILKTLVGNELVKPKKFRGGYRIDGINVSWPFVTLEIANGLMLIKGMFSKYSLIPNEVEKISNHNGVISNGIEIVSFKAGVPREIIFWSSSSDQIMSELSKNKFPVQEPN